MRIRGIVVCSTFVLALMALVLGGGGASAQTVFTCDGKIPTIVGSGNIQGTGGDDVIIGSAGPDVINGGSGNDTICGEGGDDVINGGSGGDLLVDPTGFGQTLSAGSGDDVILGNGVLLGGSGNDRVTVVLGGAADANLSINGGSGSDTCIPLGLAPFTSCELLP